MVVKTIAKVAAVAPKIKKTAQKIAKGTAKLMVDTAGKRTEKALNRYVNISPYRDKNGKKRTPVETRKLLEKENKASKAHDKAEVDYAKVKKLANKLSKMFD